MHIDRFSIDFRGRMDPPEVWPGCAPYGIMCRPHGKMYFFVDFSIKALKLAANREKQVFTFFAFLSPYIGFRPSRVCQKIELEKIYRFVSKIIDFMAYGSVMSRFCVLDRFSIDF